MYLIDSINIGELSLGLEMVILRFDSDSNHDFMLGQEELYKPKKYESFSKQRKAQYLHGRLASSIALKKLKANDCRVSQCENGFPVWPAGHVGSISHTSDIAVALVCGREYANSVGVDLEHVMAPRQAQDIQLLVISDNEFSLLNSCIDDPAKVVTSIFSAKESIFKALYPIVRKYFDFDAFELVCFDIEESKCIFRCNRHLCEQVTQGFEIEVKLVELPGLVDMVLSYSLAA